MVIEGWTEKRRNRLLLNEVVSTPFSSDVFEEFGLMGDSGSFEDSWSDFLGDSGGFSECVPAVSSGGPVVADVCVSPSSVGVLGEAFPSDSDCDIVKPQFSSFFQKASSFFLVESQADMNYDATLVKSTAGIQKKDYAAHATAESATVN